MPRPMRIEGFIRSPTGHVRLLDVFSGFARVIGNSGERVRLARCVWRLAKRIFGGYFIELDDAPVGDTSIRNGGRRSAALDAPHGDREVRTTLGWPAERAGRAPRSFRRLPAIHLML